MMIRKLQGWMATRGETKDLSVLFNEFSVLEKAITPNEQKLSQFTTEKREAVKRLLTDALKKYHPKHGWSIALLHNHLAVALNHTQKDSELFYILYWDVETLVDAIKAKG